MCIYSCITVPVPPAAIQMELSNQLTCIHLHFMRYMEMMEWTGGSEHRVSDAVELRGAALV